MTLGRLPTRRNTEHCIRNELLVMPHASGRRCVTALHDSLKNTWKPYEYRQFARSGQAVDVMVITVNSHRERGSSRARTLEHCHCYPRMCRYHVSLMTWDVAYISGEQNTSC